MSSSEPQSAQPQGAWVRDVVRDLAGAGPDHAVSTRPGVAPAEPNTESGPSAPRPEEHPPESRPTPFDDAAITARVRHGESWPGRVGRWARSNVRAGQRDARLAELVEAVRRPVTTGRRIAVAGVRGGVGTTTVTLLIASVFAGRRDDAVLAVDADHELGSLRWRAKLAGDLLSAASDRELREAHLAGPGQFDELIPRTGQGLWVLPGAATDPSTGNATATRAAEAEHTLSTELHHELGRFFGVTVFDCGGELVGPRTPDAALSTAHASVLVAAATVDGVRAAHLALTSLDSGRRQADGPLTHPVIALVSRTRTSEGLDLSRATRLLERTGPEVVRLPYDRHLAAGAQIDLTRIAESTLLAVTELAGRVLAQARDRSDRVAPDRDGPDR